MSSRLAVSTMFIAALFAGSAFAQSTTGSQGTPGASGRSVAGGTVQNLPQQIQQKLTSQGFTDVQVVPEGFLVTAKDRDGDPVTMIIGPHSMTMFTAVPAGSVEHRSSSQPGSGGASTTNK